MNTTANMHQSDKNTATRRSLLRASALWTLQALLALLFLLTGIMKLFTPADVLMAQLFIPLPLLFVRFVGLAECAGALGLILPGLLRIQPRLTPLAACGLVLIMIGATVTTLMVGLVSVAVISLVVGLLCAVVAYTRRSWLLQSLAVSAH